MATAEHDNASPAFRLRAKPRTCETPASIIPEPEMLEILLEMSGYRAWRCVCAKRRPKGSIVQTKGNCHLDLVSKAGARHQIVNRALLCPYHNIMKSNHRLRLAEYREEIAKTGELMVDDVSELIDLTYAAHKSMASTRSGKFRSGQRSLTGMVAALPSCRSHALQQAAACVCRQHGNEFTGRETCARHGLSALPLGIGCRLVLQNVRMSNEPVLGRLHYAETDGGEHDEREYGAVDQHH